MLMKMRSKMQNQKGFTLVELMVVVVILGILVAIAVPVYNNVTTSANRNAVEANLRTIDGAITAFGAANEGAVAVQADLYTADGTNNFLQDWPSGPDGVAYTVVDGRAVATADEDTGAWWTPDAGASLPIVW